jgi:Domain of unknown function (DUF222)/HNH endonuclease
MANALPLVHVPDGTRSASPLSDAPALSRIEDLGESIAALAAQLHAATFELLVLLREFDERLGWNNGFLSCAHWLHWRTGIDLGAAREKVRVARALATLPQLSDAMRRGRLSYAKVRAVTRIATPASEERLLHLALAATAAQVERLVKAWRHADLKTASRQTEERHLARQLTTWIDDDGMVIIRGRLTPDAGAIVLRALELTSDRLFRESANNAKGGELAEDTTSGQRRADALTVIAEAALGVDLDRGCTADYVQVVLHVESGAVVAGSPGLATEATAFTGALEVGPGAIRVSAETSLRLACDASVVEMRHDGHHEALTSGRKMRTVPSSIRRALAARDATCQFPACTSRRCDAHHIVHWADGGATGLDNLVRLCRRHHRAVHEGGFALERTAAGLAFRDPRNRRLDVAPTQRLLEPGETPLHGVVQRLQADGVAVDAGSTPVWDGTRFDLGWALTVVHDGIAGPA